MDKKHRKFTPKDIIHGKRSRRNYKVLDYGISTFTEQVILGDELIIYLDENGIIYITTPKILGDEDAYTLVKTT